MLVRRRPALVHRFAPIAILAVLTFSVRADGVGSVSTVAPRPLGMGGAFVAVEDRLAAMAWNPAGLLPPACSRGTNLRLHLNILGAPAIARETGLLTGALTEPYASLSVAEQAAVAIGSVIKGATLRRGGLSVGVLLLEEELDPVGLAESRGLADAGDLLDGYYANVVVSFRLDPRVSVGATATILAGGDGEGDRRHDLGRVYGALLKPNDRVTVGLTYFDLPAGFESIRRGIEGLAPRTMNGGIAYRPADNVVVAFDLRDLGEKHHGTSLEPRAGLEWNPWGETAVRVGAFREEGSGDGVLTLGLGAISMPGCRVGGETPGGDTFVLDYATLLSDGAAPRYLLSVLLQF
jgi:hypothetical protein